MGFRIDSETHNLVDDISFSIQAGKVMGVVGESGCGKSMTSLSIMKLLPPEAVVQGGEIVFNGQNIINYSEAAMEKIRGRDIGMVFQEPMTSLNPVYTVGRQIGEVYRVHKVEMQKDVVRKDVIELLSKVGISNPEKRIDQYPHQLSGGMRQRVMIAMAIACRPQLLIADEPTTALDVTIQAQVLELMQEIKHETQGAIMLVTHNLGVVAETCDDAVVMYAGQIVEKGTINHIFDSPTHPYTRGLMASIPSFGSREEELYSIPGTVPTIENLGIGCRFAARCKQSKEHCSRKTPPMREIESGHSVACWDFGGE
jgi:oligopeptide/dipeptide ABC transporter ATP-binding protein